MGKGEQKKSSKVETMLRRRKFLTSTHRIYIIVRTREMSSLLALFIIYFMSGQNISNTIYAVTFDQTDSRDHKMVQIHKKMF